MGWVEKEEGSPACGYGLLGLCCSACLLGPCRISPFEKASGKGICGDSPDIMVAKNLFRAVRKEALEELERLKERAANLSSRHSDKILKKRVSKEEERKMIKKYGFSGHLSGKTLIRRLSKEIEKLLSIQFQDRPALLGELLPERVFASLYRNAFPYRSLMDLLIDSTKGGMPGGSEVEDVLLKSLQVSTIPLISEEVRGDADVLIGGKEFSQGDARGPAQRPDTLEGLSSNSSPVMLILDGQNTTTEGSICQIARELEKLSKGKLFTLSFRGIGILPEVGRRLTEKRGLPVNDMRVLVLISSPLTAWTLGSLALGFNVISVPDLPVHGSERVEKFFSEDLKRRFGNTYFSTRRDNFLSDVLGFLG